MKPSFITLRINPQKFNLDKNGFTLIVTPHDIAASLLALKPPQLKSILKQIEAHSDFIIYEQLENPKRVLNQNTL